MPGASDPPGRRAYPSHPWLRPKASRSGAPRSPERDGARSLPSGRLFSLMCLRFAATPKKKKQASQRVREVARATSALLEAVVQKVAIHNCVSGSLAPVFQCSWRGRQLLKCLSGMRGSVLAGTRKFSSCFVVA